MEKNRHRKALFSSLAEQGLQWYLESLADDSAAVLIGRDEDQGRLNQEGKKGVTAIIFFCGYTKLSGGMMPSFCGGSTIT